MDDKKQSELDRVKHINHILKQAESGINDWARFMGKAMFDHLTPSPEPVAHEGEWWWSVGGDLVREMSGDEVLECIKHEALPTKAILVMANSYDIARHFMRGINPHRWQLISEREVPPPIMHPTVIKCPGTRYSAYFHDALMTVLKRREPVWVTLTEERPAVAEFEPIQATGDDHARADNKLWY